jgi:hypothetical protein
MTWTKVGDEFADECWELSNVAFRLHTEGLIWSNRKHLDGRLTKDEMPRWAKRPDAAGELVAIGFWEDRDDHFQIIHQGAQRTAAEWLHQSAVNRANRAKGKARPVRPKDDSSDSSSNGSYSDSSVSNDSSDEWSDERDWSGLVRAGMEKKPNYVSAKRGKNDGFPDDDLGNAYDRECAEYFAAGAAYQPPTTDPDGFPLDEWGER